MNTATESTPASAPAARRAAAIGVSLPGRLLMVLISLYQRTLSPLLPVVSLGACGCRFTPTCSHYALDAIRVHGALTGTRLAVIRLLKCTPLHPGGPDPVPPLRPSRRAAFAPICRAIKPG